jgi:malate permease and related proteins
MTTDFLTLLAVLTPVTFMVAAGCFARWRGILTPEAEGSLLKLVINVLFPCLVVYSVLGNDALRQVDNLVLPPLVGFVTMLLGIAAGYSAARLVGLKRGAGLRTFAFAVGIYNYGYIPIPIVQQLFPEETLGVLFVHNLGCDLAVWTVGVIVVAGASWREGWRRAINPPAIAIVCTVVLNALGLGENLPRLFAALIEGCRLLGICAVPLGLVVVGSTLYDFLREPRQLWDARVVSTSVLLRLAALPWVFLIAAKWLPLSVELKQVMIVEAAMPAGMSSLLIARLYGGRPLTAAQVIVGTTVAALFVIPWWIDFGLRWVQPGLP